VRIKQRNTAVVFLHNSPNPQLLNGIRLVPMCGVNFSSGGLKLQSADVRFQLPHQSSGTLTLRDITTFPLVRFKPRFPAVIQLFFVGGRLRLPCGKSQFLRGLCAIFAVSCGREPRECESALESSRTKYGCLTVSAVPAWNTAISANLQRNTSFRNPVE